ncbi:MAG: hypothetical protein QNK23_09065 [Crocinitomicaceae bacterium]|nr:hypothetical protein [Crocinitomicaceae bacterium]
MTKLQEKLTQLRTKLINEPNWVTVYQSADEYTIRIQKLKLESKEIPVALFDQRDSSYNAFGHIYLNVPKEFEEQALEIIKEENE